MEDELGRKKAIHKKYGLQSIALSVTWVLTISIRRNITLCCGLHQKMTFTVTSVDSVAKSEEKGNKMPEPPKSYVSRLKQDFIYSQGFKFNLRRRIFINRKKKTVISFEFASKHGLDTIKKIINLREKSKDSWTIHFIEKLKPRVRKQFLEAIRQ